MDSPDPTAAPTSRNLRLRHGSDPGIPRSASERTGNSADVAAVPVVRYEGIGKAYGSGDRTTWVLRDVDLSLPEGAFVVILGRSGSGKSTLLNLTAGIDAPTTGRIYLAGTEITGLSDRQRTLLRRERIGFVFQFFNLIPTLTVVENIQLPMELSGRTDEAARRARELLADVGLAGREDDFPDRLSGGEQQRVAIARALVARPEIILADEPTGNLDAETGERVMDLLLRITRDAGRTLLVATHSRAVAARADLVLRIDGDRLDPVPPEDLELTTS